MARSVLAVASALCFSTVATTTAPLDSKQAANLFNTWFTGDEADGLVLRQAAEWEVWCEKGCFRGRPDCKLSASYAHLSYSACKGDPVYCGIFWFAPLAGVVFNPELVKRELASCYFASDGRTWTKYNGGCGCDANQADFTCSSPHSPFANVGPDGKVVYGDTPEAERCRCKDDKVPWDGKRGDECFWRGPAFNTSHGPFGKTEFPHLLNQLSHQTSKFAEVVLNSHALLKALAHDPASVVLGVYYIRGAKFSSKMNEGNLKQAQDLQRQYREKQGVEVPIVALDTDVPLSKSQGPFFEHVATNTSIVV